MAKEKVKEKIIPVEKKPKKKLGATLFSTLMAIISLITGVYLIMQYYGLYQTEIPIIALAIIMILTGLSGLVQIGKIRTLMRIERIKSRYI